MTNELLYAAVADDDTGASDLAGMFADQGLRTVLVLDPEVGEDLLGWAAGAQVVVFATATRAIEPRAAYGKTRAAVALAASLHPRAVQIKYCSTFDSTAEGNIGPSLDAALDALEERFTIALPALPVNGRTTYFGYHFVNGQLLADSPMRRHPLNPMTESNLVAWLGRQTARRVGLTPYPVVESGPEAVLCHWEKLRQEGIAISLVDCCSDRHAAALCEAACALRLVSGGSAFGMHLPAAWRRRGWLDNSAFEVSPVSPGPEGCGCLVVAGSCSVMTAAQNRWLAGRGATVLQVAVEDLLTLGMPVENARRALARGESVLLKTRSGAGDIAQAKAWGEKRGWSGAELGLKIAEALAAAVREIVTAQPPRVLVSAGGETSGALCRALGIRAFRVGRNIQPGVPICYPAGAWNFPMVLKSGNFGSEDFYEAAFAAAQPKQTLLN
jgi:uncharacterized protein YgbK (DUF1537 family)